MIDLAIMLTFIMSFFVGAIVGSMITIAKLFHWAVHNLPITKTRIVYRTRRDRP